MAPKSTLAGLLALTSLSTAAPNQNRFVEVDTDELILPPTDSGDDLWATVLSDSDHATEYLVACKDAFSHPEDCKGPYKGVTVTQSANSMSLKLDGKSYDCVWNDSGDVEMECVVGNDQEFISGDDLDAWVAEVTVVEPANLELRDAGSEVEKRKGGGSSGGRGGSSSGKSSGKSGGSSRKKGSSDDSDGSSGGSSGGSSRFKSSKGGGSGSKNSTDDDENGVGPNGMNSLPSTFAVAVAALGFALAL